jgi:hypothetical protein
MRLSHPRGPWPLWSMLAAAFALLAVSLAGSGTLEGGRLVRVGRSAQRLEAADGIPHSHEQDEPDPAPSGLMVSGAAALNRIHAAPPGHAWNGRAKLRAPAAPLVWPMFTPALAAAPPGARTRLTLHDVYPLSARPIRPALGRAPPTA